MLFIILIFLLILIGYFFVGKVPQAKEIKWGVNFSQKQAENLGLDWQAVFISLIGDMGVRNFKIITHWDLIEVEERRYSFDDLDWQIEKIEESGAKAFLALGMKTPGWPECHIPEWAGTLNKQKQQEVILDFLKNIVLRYKDSSAIWAWQVENEPFFPFGECPWVDKSFLKKEIDLVKSLDAQNRPIIISDSGEFSFWIAAARLGDKIATTLHRKVWFQELKMYIKYPLPPVFYWRKAQIIGRFFHKDVFVGELQAEPWCFKYLGECPISEQEKTMNLEQFKKNIEFARNTGLNEFYLWGGEWWYWLKEKQNKPEIWDEAQKLFIINL